MSQPGWGANDGGDEQGGSIQGKVRKRDPSIEEVSRGVHLWRQTAGDPIVIKSREIREDEDH